MSETLEMTTDERRKYLHKLKIRYWQVKERSKRSQLLDVMEAITGMHRKPILRLLHGALSHDQITRTLADERLTSRSWWQLVKLFIRQIERPDGVMLSDDTIVEKPHTDENEIICWHYDHAKGRKIKGLNLLTTLYFSQEAALPVAFEIVAKTGWQAHAGLPGW